MDYKGTICIECHRGKYVEHYTCGRDDGLVCSYCGKFMHRYGEKSEWESNIRRAKLEIKYAKKDIEVAIRKAFKEIAYNKSQIKFYEDKIKEAKN